MPDPERVTAYRVNHTLLLRGKHGPMGTPAERVQLDQRMAAESTSWQERVDSR